MVNKGTVERASGHSGGLFLFPLLLMLCIICVVCWDMDGCYYHNVCSFGINSSKAASSNTHIHTLTHTHEIIFILLCTTSVHTHVANVDYCRFARVVQHTHTDTHAVRNFLRACLVYWIARLAPVADTQNTRTSHARVWLI